MQPFSSFLWLRPFTCSCSQANCLFHLICVSSTSPPKVLVQCTFQDPLLLHSSKTFIPIFPIFLNNGQQFHMKFLSYVFITHLACTSLNNATALRKCFLPISIHFLHCAVKVQPFEPHSTSGTGRFYENKNLKYFNKLINFKQ